MTFVVTIRVPDPSWYCYKTGAFGPFETEDAADEFVDSVFPSGTWSENVEVGVTTMQTEIPHRFFM